jgi:hypothetical protein
MGAGLVKPENLISKPNAGQKVFEDVVDIGGNPTKVRTVLNEAGKLRSIHIRNK